MKKIILKSILISLILNIVCLIVNLVTYLRFKKIFLALKFSGGEWGGTTGFGIMINKTYPMSTQDAVVTGKTWLSVDPISFLIPFVIIFVIAFVILKLKQKA